MSDGATDDFARAQARVGQVLKGKWTLDRLLGVGGMGAVYAATHRNRKRGALKILHPELSSDSGIRERFLREGYVANSVGHQGAVEVFDDDIADDGAAYLVMELLEGESVEHRWDRKGRRLPAREVLAIADQLLETLTLAHERDIVHRDLKPENLFLQKGGVLKVLDFGIARLRETGKSATATQTGSAMGTPAFMAPEQARGRWDEVDNRTDLWAVGASMFTLLTGSYVHGSAGTVNEIIARAITQPAPSLASPLPSADPALISFVDKALAYQPQERFQNALEMQTALRELYHSLDGKAEMRAVQPSMNDGDVIASSGGTQLLSSESASTSGAPAVAAVSNATLTTGRPMVTASSSESALSKPSLPKWLPLAGVGAFAAVALAMVLGSGGPEQPAVSASLPSAAAAAPLATSSAATPTIAPEAPSPPAAAVDIASLPKLESSARAVAMPPAPSTGKPSSKPEAASPPKVSPALPPAAPPAKPATTSPPSALFKKRQ